METGAENMEQIAESVDTKVGRRNVLKGGVAAVGALGAATLTGGRPETVHAQAGPPPTPTKSPADLAEVNRIKAEAAREDQRAKAQQPQPATRPASEGAARQEDRGGGLPWGKTVVGLGILGAAGLAFRRTIGRFINNIRRPGVTDAEFREGDGGGVVDAEFREAADARDAPYPRLPDLTRGSNGGAGETAPRALPRRRIRKMRSDRDGNLYPVDTPSEPDDGGTTSP